MTIEYEYLIEGRPLSEISMSTMGRMHGGELNSWLNKLGRDGWELCSVIEDKYGSSEFFFKRRLVPDLQ